MIGRGQSDISMYRFFHTRLLVTFSLILQVVFAQETKSSGGRGGGSEKEAAERMG